MEFEERLKKAKELFGEDVHIVSSEERKRKKSSGKYRKLGAFKYHKHPEMDKSQYFSCASKHPYKSQGEARKYANRLEQARGRKLRVYQCEYCGLFHLTSKPIRKHGK